MTETNLFEETYAKRLAHQVSELQQSIRMQEKLMENLRAENKKWAELAHWWMAITEAVQSEENLQEQWGNLIATMRLYKEIPGVTCEIPPHYHLPNWQVHINKVPDKLLAKTVADEIDATTDRMVLKQTTLNDARDEVNEIIQIMLTNIGYEEVAYALDRMHRNIHSL